MFIEFDETIPGKKVSIRSDRIVGFQHVEHELDETDLRDGEKPSHECCEIFTDDDSSWTVGHTYEEVKSVLVTNTQGDQ